MLSAIEKAVCNLIAYGLKGVPFAVEVEDWNAVYKEMKWQTVSNIPIFMLKKEYHNEVVDEWYKLCCVESLQLELLLMKQRDLLNLLREAGYHPVILKGCAAAIYFPDIKMRSFGDIDFLVPEEEFKAAYQLMLDNGYTLLRDEDNVDYHYTLEKNGVIFEIHNKPSGLDLLTKDVQRLLYSCFQKACYNAEIHVLNKYEIPIMPVVENGMVLLLHILKHMKNGLGLRHLIDWMLFCEQELNDAAYKEKYESILKKSGLNQLAKCMTRTCQKYLGMSQDGFTWCQCEEALCDELIEYLFEQGNFGRKMQGDESRGTQVLATKTSPVALLKHFQKRGLINWKAAQEYKVLRPVAWIYQIVNNMQRIRAVGGLKNIKNSVSKGRKRKDFFNRLGLPNN